MRAQFYQIFFCNEINNRIPQHMPKIVYYFFPKPSILFSSCYVNIFAKLDHNASCPSRVRYVKITHIIIITLVVELEYSESCEIIVSFCCVIFWREVKKVLYIYWTVRRSLPCYIYTVYIMEEYKFRNSQEVLNLGPLFRVWDLY